MAEAFLFHFGLFYLREKAVAVTDKLIILQTFHDVKRNY